MAGSGRRCCSTIRGQWSTSNSRCFRAGPERRPCNGAPCSTGPPPGRKAIFDKPLKARPRELAAADCVCSVGRCYDPAIVAEHLHTFENAKLLGLSELRRQVIASKTPFAGDVEVRLAEPNPRVPQVLSGLVAVAR